jgi:DNA-binding NtrC family response regulator
MDKTQTAIRLLLVDDEEEFLDACSRALSRRGIVVHTARNGADALGLLPNNEFDVAVLDIKMPGMDGVELLKRIRTAQPHVACIMLTGHGSTSTAFETSREGIFDYLAKPCDMEALAIRIHEAAKTGKVKAEPKAQTETAEDVQLLLVDDEESLLDSLSTVLKRRRMQVTTAVSGEEALRRLQEKLIDVVVLDIKMPGMDGLEALQRIKKEHSTIEVVLLTGHPTLQNAMEGMKFGAADYVIKPPDIDELVGKIRDAQKRRLEALAARQQKIVEEIKDRIPE